jgi:hypothetical protein
MLTLAMQRQLLQTNNSPLDTTEKKPGTLEYGTLEGGGGLDVEPEEE